MQSSEWCFTEVYEDLCLRFLELHETEQAGALYNLPWRSLEFLPATATLARKPSTQAPVAEILQASLSPAMLQAKRGFMRFRLISLTLGPPEWKEEKEPVLKTSWQQKMLEIPRCLQLSHLPKNDQTHVSGDFFGALQQIPCHRSWCPSWRQCER